MLFLPLKPNFPLPRLPWLTMLIVVICLAIYVKQDTDRKAYAEAIYAHCEAQRSHIKEMIFKRIAPDSDNRCVSIVHGIALAPDEQVAIDEIVSELQPISGFDLDDTRFYVADMLQEELRQYHSVVPEDPDAWVAYDTSTWNPWQMFMSAFGHADWSHVIFNVIFFAAFAAAVEIMTGAAEYENARAMYYGPPHVPKPPGELLGEMYLTLERPEEAAAYFEASLNRNTSRSMALLGLARAQEAIGDPRAAQTWQALDSNWQGDSSGIRGRQYGWLSN